MSHRSSVWLWGVAEILALVQTFVSVLAVASWLGASHARQLWPATEPQCPQPAQAWPCIFCAEVNHEDASGVRATARPQRADFDSAGTGVYRKDYPWSTA
jgi:hypothetical protein